MPDLNLATPALLFPALSLLLLAYTNRFLALAALIRSLYDRWEEKRDQKLLSQIENLRRRVVLIRNMQLSGVLSILLCVVAMFCLYEGWARVGSAIFAGALLALIASLILSLREIQLSVVALNVQLEDIEDERR
jgi:uncharacterized membrane protein YbhN (UPF0104 family)